MGGRKSLTVYDGMTGMMENAFINVKGVHHTITAEVEVTDAKTSGVIIAQAGYFGGWTLYMKDGKVHHEYNWFALERTNIAAPSAARRRASTRSCTSSSPTKPSPAPAASPSSTVDGKKVAEGPHPEDAAVHVLRRRRRRRGRWTARPTCRPTTSRATTSFTGKIVKVTIDVKPIAMGAGDKKMIRRRGSCRGGSGRGVSEGTVQRRIRLHNRHHRRRFVRRIACRLRVAKRLVEFFVRTWAAQEASARRRPAHGRGFLPTIADAKTAAPGPRPTAWCGSPAASSRWARDDRARVAVRHVRASRATRCRSIASTSTASGWTRPK